MRAVTLFAVRWFGIACLLIPVFAFSALAAETTLPVHKCHAPIKQREFATKMQLDRYKAEVDLFRSCIEAFVKEQEEAIEAHRQATQAAIDDWRKFVGPEANAPPKAPENRDGGSGFRGKP